MNSSLNAGNLLHVGTFLHGTYRIDRYLSSGGFGNTYVATNIQFGEQYAIKEFFMRGISQRDNNNTTVSVSNTDNRDTFASQLEKFKKEARRLRKLNNEHIVRVHDLFEENGTAYYVMDYIDGENLSDRLRRTGKPLSEAEVMQLLPQILDALQAAHKEGILHLDLKPANIMVDRQGVVKLIDFGASKQQSAQGGATTSTAVSYTNGYAPREQMEQNLEKFGPWTDFYALGATLYNLITNKKPPLPSDIDDDSSVDKHLALPMPASCIETLRKFVLCLLQTDRGKRPQSDDDIYDYRKKIETDEKLLDTQLEKDNTLLVNQNATEHTSFAHCPFNELLEKAVNGDDEAQFELGSRYFKGVGVKKDYKLAVKWFEKSAISCNPHAECSLAFCYYNGDGIKKNYKEALSWFIKAAEQGDAEAQNQIGVIFTKGKGVRKDLEQARLWFIKSSKNGFKKAEENLIKLDDLQIPFIKRHNIKRVGKGEKKILELFLWIISIAFMTVCLIGALSCEEGYILAVCNIICWFWPVLAIIMWLTYIPKRRFFTIQIFLLLVLTAICWIINSISIYNPEFENSYFLDHPYYYMHSHSPFGDLLRVGSENNNEELKEEYFTNAYRAEINYVIGFIVTLFLLIMIKIRFLHIIESIMAKIKSICSHDEKYKI